MHDPNLNDLFYDTDCLSATARQLNLEFRKFPLNYNYNYFSILNVNIRSLPKNFPNLVCFLPQIKLRFTLIAVTETWLSDDDNGLYSLTGYNHVSLNRKGRGGGIRIYFSQELNVNILETLTGIFNSHESLSVEILMPSMGNLNVIAVYRPPSKHISGFNTFIHTEFFQRFYKPTMKYILTGDINIHYNESNTYESTHVSDYYSYFQSHLFKFHITNATRLSDTDMKETLRSITLGAI